MPRIMAYAESYATEDFRQELFHKIVDRYGDLSVRKLADEAGISQTTLNQKIRHSARNLDVHELRLIIPLLKPDPSVVLKLLGYTAEDLRRYKNKKTEE